MSWPTSMLLIILKSKSEYSSCHEENNSAAIKSGFCCVFCLHATPVTSTTVRIVHSCFVSSFQHTLLDAGF